MHIQARGLSRHGQAKRPVFVETQVCVLSTADQGGTPTGGSGDGGLGMIAGPFDAVDYAGECRVDSAEDRRKRLAVLAPDRNGGEGTLLCIQPEVSGDLVDHALGPGFRFIARGP